VVSRLEPASVDPPAARRLARRAVDDRRRADAEAAEWARNLTERLDAGAVPSWLYRVGSAVRGFVSWTADSPLGVSVDLLSLEPELSRPEEYGRLLDEVERQAGPIAFLHGSLPGLSAEEEALVLRGRGWRRFARIEMVRDPSVPLAERPPAPEERLRSVLAPDLDALAELHRDAYRDRFDRYLFLESTDERDDARREVRQILEGRWGPFAAEGSCLLERDDRAVGAVLSVWGPVGALIADVMVDPAARGAGRGAVVLAEAVRRLEAAGASRVYLNVTVGNEPALRLYRRLGFVRSLGPSSSWYNARRIPVPPAPDA
jgi:ribosomal protein S18 acetylase RimI-like enzyme